MRLRENNEFGKNLIDPKKLVLCPGNSERLDLMIGALNIFQYKNIDFADAVLASQALRIGPPSIYSFDHHLNLVPGIRVLKPS